MNGSIALDFLFFDLETEKARSVKQANLRYYPISVYSTVFIHPSLITLQKRRDISNKGLLTGLFIHHSSFIIFLSFISITSSLISVFAFTYRIRQIKSTLEPIQITHPHNNNNNNSKLRNTHPTLKHPSFPTNNANSNN